MKANFWDDSSLNSECRLICDKALEFVEVSLAGKRRKSGEEVVDHCLRVGETLTKYHITDPQSLAVAILHHTLKESAATTDDVKKEFGEEIAQMLQNFEKLHIVRLKSGMKDEFVENLRKMFLILAKDLRIVLIKLADIMDNLTTLQYLDAEKRKEAAQETLEIFAPLVERLGMGEMRGKMQDLAFMHLYPKEYRWVKQCSAAALKRLEKEFPKIKLRLLKKLAEEGIDVKVQNRIKHIHSLYTKLLRPEFNKDITKIPDLLAMRVITQTKEDCYRVLGVINKVFEPIPGRISDYIAHPKPNGYQSIHIKIYGPQGIPVEVQIRTSQMHEEAEYGVAAHWNYTENKEKGFSDKKISQGFAASAEKLEWVKKLSEWQKEVSDNQEFLKSVKTDFFGARIYCFTPKGDVKDLPAGATPIDFAYTVHTNMGNLVTGTRVNGKVVSLGTKLNNGDVVELILSKDTNKKPSQDWLGFVVTSLAKRIIKKAYIG